MNIKTKAKIEQIRERMITLKDKLSSKYPHLFEEFKEQIETALTRKLESDEEEIIFALDCITLTTLITTYIVKEEVKKTGSMMKIIEEGLYDGGNNGNRILN